MSRDLVCHHPMSYGSITCMSQPMDHSDSHNLNASPADVSQPSSTIVFRPEAKDGSDIDGIHKLLCDAFNGVAEANLVRTLRREHCYNYRLSRVAVDSTNKQIVGFCLLSNIELSYIVALDQESEDSRQDQHHRREIIPVLSLAPVAVASRYQRRGIGSQLIRETLHIAQGIGHSYVFVLGHTNYYSRFGFDASLANNIDSVYSSSPNMMALELQTTAKGRLQRLKDAKLRYSEPFNQL